MVGILKLSKHHRVGHITEQFNRLRISYTFRDSNDEGRIWITLEMLWSTFSVLTWSIFCLYVVCWNYNSFFVYFLSRRDSTISVKFTFITNSLLIHQRPVWWLMFIIQTVRYQKQNFWSRRWTKYGRDFRHIFWY